MSIFGGRSEAFIVYGKVEPHARPRHDRTHTYQEHSEWYYRILTAWKKLGFASFGASPLIFVIKTHRRAPKGITVPQTDTVKPDLDNIIKEALDALQAAGAFNDDRQIIGINAMKAPRMAMYSDDDEWAEIELHEWVTTLEE